MLNKRKKIYQVGGPYFSSKDINWILKKARKVLKYKDLFYSRYLKEFLFRKKLFFSSVSVC